MPFAKDGFTFFGLILWHVASRSFMSIVQASKLRYHQINPHIVSHLLILFRICMDRIVSSSTPSLSPTYVIVFHVSFYVTEWLHIPIQTRHNWRNDFYKRCIVFFLETSLLQVANRSPAALVTWMPRAKANDWGFGVRCRPSPHVSGLRR